MLHATGYTSSQQPTLPFCYFQLFSKSIAGKFMLVGLTCLPLILLFGALYAVVGEVSLGRAFYTAFGLLSDSPGNYGVGKRCVV